MTVEINPDKVLHILQDKYKDTQETNTASILSKMKETYLFTDQYRYMNQFLDIKRIDLGPCNRQFYSYDSLFTSEVIK